MKGGAIEHKREAIHAHILSCVLGREGEGLAEENLQESVALARAIDLDIVAAQRVVVSVPRAATLLGAGKVAELGECFSRKRISLAVVDAELTPVQQRNLERAWKVKVLDRTGLILEIFAARARSREGRLQVEMARLIYQKSRLVRGWSHLERQRGGMGFLGGPGETQLEADRRMLQERISRLARQLERVRRTRSLHRKRRKRASLPLVSLVGYTNCGKSTLFNRLTEADVLVRDMLFATLDPTVRGVKTGAGGFLLSDTVGFIRNLPASLVMAFRATLEEITEADILLHVHDASRSEEERRRQSRNVEEILAGMGIDHDWERRILHIYNKADVATSETRVLLGNQARRQGNLCLISARNGEGMESLIRLLENHIARLAQEGRFACKVQALWLKPEEEDCRAWLHRHGHVASEARRRDARGRLLVRVVLSANARGRMAKAFPEAAVRLFACQKKDFLSD